MALSRREVIQLFGLGALVPTSKKVSGVLKDEWQGFPSKKKQQTLRALHEEISDWSPSDTMQSTFYSLKHLCLLMIEILQDLHRRS